MLSCEHRFRTCGRKSAIPSVGNRFTADGSPLRKFISKKKANTLRNRSEEYFLPDTHNFRDSTVWNIRQSNHVLGAFASLSS